MDKLVKWIKNDYDLTEFVAFDNGTYVESINRDLDSIKKALNEHNKLFYKLGFSAMRTNMMKNRILYLIMTIFSILNVMMNNMININLRLEDTEFILIRI